MEAGQFNKINIIKHFQHFFFLFCDLFWLLMLCHYMNSEEQAQASHVYSYRHGFRGFAARLTDDQASQISSKFSQAHLFLYYYYFFLSLEFLLDEKKKNGVVFTEIPGVVSVFPNGKRRLHTTHSWDFMGLLDDETMEVLGYDTKNQVNVVVGFIDTGKNHTRLFRSRRLLV